MRKSFISCTCLWLFIFTATVFNVAQVHASTNASAAEPLPEETSASTKADIDEQEVELDWLRVKEEAGRQIALQIASREFVRAESDGPQVSLVGVAHIGDASFYEALATHLDEYDVVLYESVKPAGAGGAGGATDSQRRASTTAALELISSLVDGYWWEHEEVPADFNSLRKYAVTVDPRYAHFVDAASIDAWGNQVQLIADPTEETELSEGGDVATRLPVHVVSWGEDGQPGGEGVDADLVAYPTGMSVALSHEDGLQAQLASALHLQFQLTALDYNQPNWQCSDMALDQVNRALAEEGIDFIEFSETLSGTSLPAKFIKFMLGLMRLADAFVGGAIVDTFKVVMIELLSDQSLMEESMDVYGEGFTKVLIKQRNQVVIDDLATLIQEDHEVQSVAILYGAAHMSDMATRLNEQLGYVPVEHQWYSAIAVDLEKSAVNPRDLKQIQMMIRMSMAQQKQRMQQQAESAQPE